MKMGKKNQAQSCAHTKTKKKVLAQQERQPPIRVPFLSEPLKKKFIGYASQSCYFKNGTLSVTPSFFSPAFDCELIAFVALLIAPETLVLLGNCDII